MARRTLLGTSWDSELMCASGADPRSAQGLLHTRTCGCDQDPHARAAPPRCSLSDEQRCQCASWLQASWLQWSARAKASSARAGAVLLEKGLATWLVLVCLCLGSQQTARQEKKRVCGPKRARVKTRVTLVTHSRTLSACAPTRGTRRGPAAPAVPASTVLDKWRQSRHSETQHSVNVLC